jgi:copper chaperone
MERDMQKYKVPDMSCGHCVATIEKAIRALDSNAAVACDLDRKEVSVTTSVAPERIADALAQVGYQSETLAA